MKPRRLAIIVLVLCLSEIIGYFIAFQNRGPAANLRYWAYTDGRSQKKEEVLYVMFYPAYFIHTRVFGADKQFTDREPFNPSPDDHT